MPDNLIDDDDGADGDKEEVASAPPAVRDPRKPSKHSKKEHINYELIASLVAYIHHQPRDGAILLFLPGFAEIKKCVQLICNELLLFHAFTPFYLDA